MRFRTILIGLLLILAPTLFAQSISVNGGQIWVDGVLKAGGGGSGGLSGTVSESTNNTAFAASATEDITFADVGGNVNIMIRGRLFIPNADDAPFSAEATLSFFEHSDRRGEQAIYRATMDLVCVLTTSPQTAGNNTLVVADASDFNEQDLLYVLGPTPEFIRITSIVGTTITLENNLLYDHASGVGVSRVPEFGGFTLMDSTDAKTIWARVDFGASQTVDTRMILTYTR